MSEGKPHRAMGQLMASEPDPVNTTIVGGQPPRKQGQTVKVPAGVERALFLAATDEAFCRELFEDRAGAVQTRGLQLSASELAMLRAAPQAQLRAIIDGLDVSAGNVQRRRFMQAVAVGAAALAAGCGDDGGKTDAPGPGPDATGILADMPGPGTDAVAGLQDAMPPSDFEVPQDLAPGADSTGIRPGDGSR